MKKYIIPWIQLGIFLSIMLKGIMAQEIRIDGAERHPLYILEENLKAGQKETFKHLATYLDGTEILHEFMGHHLMKRPEKEIANRIIEENTAFLDAEFFLTDSSSRHEFQQFLDINFDRIVYSDLADVWLITPFKEREVSFQVREIADIQKLERGKKKVDLLKQHWVIDNGIDRLIEERNPRALLEIAAHYVRQRRKYVYNEEEYFDLVRCLTGTNIIVADKTGKLDLHPESHFDFFLKFQWLTFFVQNHAFYVWDEGKGIFVHPSLEVTPISKERDLFERLKSEEDSIAFQALIDLSTRDPDIVSALAKEFDKANIHLNFCIGSSPYRRIPALSRMIDYFEMQGIDFRGSDAFQNRFMQLLHPDNIRADRYRVAGEIYDSLKLEEVTALEYWTLIYDRYVGYSGGIILNKWYSKHWEEVVNNPQELLLFLKKANMFKRAGGHGFWREYLSKCCPLSADLMASLKGLQTDDEEIQEQIRLILEQACADQYEYTPPEAWEYHMTERIPDAETPLLDLTTHVTDSSKTETAIRDILDQLGYSQLGIAARLTADYPFQNNYEKFRYIISDFGIPLPYPYSSECLQQFADHHETMTPLDLYEYYWELDGKRLYTEGGSIDFDHIYDILKYENLPGFTTHGFGLTRFLELSLNTSLGFPEKKCEHKSSKYCSAKDRIIAWMHYLESSDLLRLPHNEPDAFGQQKWNK